MTASISISIPAYNEETTIASVVSESLRVLERYTDDFEVVVINDGSIDRTGLIVEELAQKDPHIRVFHHDRNLGFGQTIKEVWSYPQKEWVFFIPGDGQVPASELATLWPWHDRADFILGWRKKRCDSWPRRIMALQYNALIRMVTSSRVHDIDSVALIRRALLRQMEFQSTSAFIHAECYLKACRLGARMAEVPVKHVARCAGQAHGASFTSIAKTLFEVIRYMVTPVSQ